MNVLILGLWGALALLYLARPRVAAAVYLLALPAFPFYWAPLSVVPFNDISIQQALAMGLALGLALETLRQTFDRRLAVGRLLLELAVAALVVLWSLSAFDGRTFSGATRAMALALLDFWLPYALAVRIAWRPGGPRFLLGGLAWPALAVGALALREYLAQRPLAWEWFRALASGPNDQVWAPSLRAGGLRVQATLGQPIFLGFYLACAGVLGLALATSGPAFRRLLGCLAAATLLFLSLLPMARGAMLGMALALLLLALLLRGRERQPLLVGALAGGVLLWLAAGLFASGATFWGDFLLTLVGRAPGQVQAEQLVNWEGRLEIVRVGLELIGGAPLLGHGDVSVGGAWPLQDVANVFIGLGIASGPVGLATFLLFLAGVGLQVLHLWRRESRTANRAVAAGLVAALALALTSWLDACWPGQFAQVAWVLLGLTGGWCTAPGASPSALETAPAKEDRAGSPPGVAAAAGSPVR